MRKNRLRRVYYARAGAYISYPLKQSSNESDYSLSI